MAYHITEDTPHMNKYIDFFEELLIEDDWSYQKNTDGDRCYLSAHCRGKNTQKVLILEARTGLVDVEPVLHFQDSNSSCQESINCK